MNDVFIKKTEFEDKLKERLLACLVEHPQWWPSLSVKDAEHFNSNAMMQAMWENLVPPEDEEAQSRKERVLSAILK